MVDHEAGRKHFLNIINDKEGKLKPNTCVISLGDLGESKSVYPDKTKELFAGIILDIGNYINFAIEIRENNRK
jgi:hypothetical protein